MKLKLFIVAAASLLFACGSPYRATNSSVVVVPATVQTSFSAQYPNAVNVVWTSYDPTVEPMIDWELAGWEAMDASDYVVRFDVGNDNYYAWYDNKGDWIGTAYVVKDYSTLPSAVTNTLNTQFSAYHITKVERELKKDRMAYEIVMVNGDSKIKLLIDGNGTIIRQKTK